MALAARTSVLRSCAPCRPSASRRTLVVRADVIDTVKDALPQATTSQKTVGGGGNNGKGGGGKEWLLSQPGISAPTGFFDPAGFTSAPTFTVGEAKRFRESELTHGRVAMLAALGWVVQENFHPLFGGGIGGPAFNHFQRVEGVFPQFWEVITLAIGIAEANRISKAYNPPGEIDQLKANHKPGDLAFDPLGLYPSDTKSQNDIQTRELNNGRLAMIAIAGFAAQEEVNHETIFGNLQK